MRDINDQYHKQLHHYNFGYALYKPVSTNDLQIGSCGYFTSDGTWNKIALLTDPKSTARAGYTTFDKTTIEYAAADQGLEWGPLKSDSVSKKGINLDISAT